MITHKMKLTLVPFEKISRGEKNIESRLYDEKRQQINPCDYVEFTCIDKPTEKILTVVRALYRYADFKHLFSDFPPLSFGGTSKEALLEEIEIFYSKEDQSKYGVIGIKIELLK